MRSRNHHLLYLLLLPLVFFYSFASARRGGGSPSGDFTSSGGGGGGGDDSGSSGDASPGGSSYTPPPPPPPCIEGTCLCALKGARSRIYELPASYYNGTLTFTHHLTSNSAWTANVRHPSTCQNSDDQPKTYSYPALFAVGPNGNASDTNPIFWVLRGFAPPGTTRKNTAKVLDVIDEWIHVRSSDFVVGDVFHTRYSSNDETGEHRETRVYWDTRVSGNGSSSWNADASYSRQPPLSSGNSFSPIPAPDSNYVTLSDVCDANMESYLRSGTIPVSDIPSGNTDTEITIPTLFFDTGAKASIKGIGADTLDFEMSGSMQRNIVFVNSGWTCDTSNAYSGGWAARLGALNAIDLYVPSDHSANMWNVSASFTISFQGGLVRENSTNINATGTSVPVWSKTYLPPKTVPSSNATSAAGDEAARSSVASLLSIAAATLIVILI